MHSSRGHDYVSYNNRALKFVFFQRVSLLAEQAPKARASSRGLEGMLPWKIFEFCTSQIAEKALIY